MENLTKRKYNKKEVEEILENLNLENNLTLKEKDSKIAILTEQLKTAKAKLNAYAKKEEEIASTAINAEVNAQKLLKRADNQYSLEIERLKLFFVKWNDYFTYLLETYPNYEIVNNSLAIKRQCENIFKAKTTDKEKIKAVDKLLNNKTSVMKTTFNPQEKIDNYIKNNSDSVFDLDEVIHPKEKLDLEDLCKQLGLMDSK